jgi:hypothetical protein
MTTATAVTWPALAELDEVSTPLGQTVEDMFEISERVRALENQLDEPVYGNGPFPTLAEVGALSRFIAIVQHELDAAGNHLAKIREARDWAAHSIQTGGDDA